MLKFKIKIASIYKISILNKEDNETYVYIGMSKDTFSRWSNHIQLLYFKKHSSPKMQSLFDNNTLEDFKFEIIEKISTTDLKEILSTQLNKKCTIKEFNNYLRTHLLKREKYHMSTYSKEYALNKDNKYFS